MLFIESTSAQLLYLASIANTILRKAFSMASIFIARDLSLSKAELGVLSSNFSLGYGITKLVSGILCDILNPRILLVIGISIGSLLLLSLPTFHSFIIINAVYFLAGSLFGLCNPALNKLAVNSISEDHIGEIWSYSTAFGNIGYLLSPFIFLSLHQAFNQNACRILGTIGMATAFHIWYAPRISLFSSENELKKDRGNDTHIHAIDLKQLVLSLMRFDLWILMVANAMVTFILKAFADWIGSIVASHKRNIYDTLLLCRLLFD